MTRVCVIGAGVIGLSSAWALARAGCTIDVFDPHPGRGASHAAAGMLAPVSEAVRGEEDTLELGLRSLGQWPGFAGQLRAASGIDVGLRESGTLLVAHDRNDAEGLHQFADRLDRLGLPANPLTGRQARGFEPALSPRTVAGVLVPCDHSVDNRALIRALMAACTAAGVRFHADRAIPVVGKGRVTGAATQSKPRLFEAEHVVVAAGFASSAVTGLDALPVGTRPVVRPVKGQILRLRGEPGLIRHTVRAHVAGRQVYLVPRATGEVVVGATTEDIGEDTQVTAQGVHDLLHAAVTVIPEVGKLELVEALARLRPASPDNVPLVGCTATDGLMLATGHYRSGVLMAPLTGEAVTSLVLGRTVAPVIARLALGRLDPRSHEKKGPA